tara:strand:+ start:173 stop:547 length:375 start_codon:yes stop_codon:yes gene_type:complete
MIQEATTLRVVMDLNLGESILGGLYDLYVDALGATMAWWLGHLTLIGLVALAYWVITNWGDVSNGLGINGRRFSAWLVIIGFTVAQYILYHDQWGFPASGAFVTAFGTSAYLWWQWYQIEPQKA